MLDKSESYNTYMELLNEDLGSRDEAYEDKKLDV